MKKSLEPKKYTQYVVGLDIGRSGVKIAFMDSGKNTCTKFFPSVILPYKQITFDTKEEVTNADTVEVRGNKYFVGETALSQGAKESIGLASNWLDGDEHLALLIRSHRYLNSYGVKPRLIVVGLPVNTFNHHSSELVRQVKEIFGQDIVVLPVPQPFGVYQDEMLNDIGEYKTTSRLTGRYAVIDIGHYTVDYLTMNEGSWVEASSGSSDGMYVAVETLRKTLLSRGVDLSIFKLQEIIHKKEMMSYGKMVDMTADVRESLQGTVKLILQSTKSYIGVNASQMDKIIVAGGGSEVVYPSIANMWGNAVKPENPRFSVALGMRKFGVFTLFSNASVVDRLAALD
jgi:plasmid segregation protein ParM